MQNTPAFMFSHTSCLQFALIAAVAGCYSTSLLQEPKPLPPGKIRGAVGFEASSRGSLTPTIGARVGLLPRTELRGKLAGGGGELGVNVQAVDSKVFDLMLMPSFIDYDIDDSFDEYATGAHLIGFALPIIASASLDEADQFQLFLGPDLRVGKRDDAPWSALGFHFGAAIAGPADHGSFIPECAFMQGLVGAAAPEASALNAALTKGTSTFSCSLGVTFGNKHHPSP